METDQVNQPQPKADDQPTMGERFNTLREMEVAPDAFAAWCHLRWWCEWVRFWHGINNGIFDEGVKILKDTPDELAAVRAATVAMERFNIQPFSFFGWAESKKTQGQIYTAEDWRKLFSEIQQARQFVGDAWNNKTFLKGAYASQKQIEHIDKLRFEVKLNWDDYLKLVQDRFGWDARYLGKEQTEQVSDFLFNEWKIKREEGGETHEDNQGDGKSRACGLDSGGASLGTSEE